MPIKDERWSPVCIQDVHKGCLGCSCPCHDTFTLGDRATAQANIDGWKSRCLAAEAECEALRKENEGLHLTLRYSGRRELEAKLVEQDATIERLQASLDCATAFCPHPEHRSNGDDLDGVRGMLLACVIGAGIYLAIAYLAVKLL